jgi:hypothetical protein
MLANPEFYSRQQIGLSVWGAPRMPRCYEESLDRLFLPRGVTGRAAKLIEKAGSRLASGAGSGRRPRQDARHRRAVTNAPRR